MQMEKFVRRRLRKLLKALGEAADNARARVDEETIHQLRVATRRLSQNLKTFAVFFAKSDVKKVRRRLRTLRDLAAELRSRDIAQKQLASAGLSSEGILARSLREERDAEVAQLNEELSHWSRRRYPQRWIHTLGLEDA